VSKPLVCTICVAYGASVGVTGLVLSGGSGVVLKRLCKSLCWAIVACCGLCDDVQKAAQHAMVSIVAVRLSWFASHFIAHTVLGCVSQG
jgi:hypothetical protein